VTWGGRGGLGGSTLRHETEGSGDDKGTRKTVGGGGGVGGGGEWSEHLCCRVSGSTMEKVKQWKRVWCGIEVGGGCVGQGGRVAIAGSR